MFVSPAFAQFGGNGDAGIGALLPLVLIFVVFYFLLIRPQQKKQKQHKVMLGAIRRGDRVVTGGGIVGTVTKVIDNDELAVQITDGVKVRVRRALVASVISKTEPVQGAKKARAGEAPAAEALGMGSILKGLFGGKDR